MTRTVNVGMHRGKGRLWLEGLWLAKAGFSRGDLITVTVFDAAVDIRRDSKGDRKVSGKDRGGVSIPVIDVNSADMTPLVGPLVVTGSEGWLVLTRPAVEHVAPEHVCETVQNSGYYGLYPTCYVCGKSLR